MRATPRSAPWVDARERSVDTTRPVVTHSGYTVLCAAPDGSIDEGSEGLFDFDTRILSRYRLTLDGHEPELISADHRESDRWQASLQLWREGGRPEGPLLPQDGLEVVIRRRVGRGMAEELVVMNHSSLEAEVSLRLELDADFADVADVGGDWQRRGSVRRRWLPELPGIEIDYRAVNNGRSFQRAVRVRIADGGDHASWARRSIIIPLRLAAHGSWRGLLAYESKVDGNWRRPEPIDGGRRAGATARWREHRTAIECAEPLRGPFDRAADDLFALRNQDLEAELLGPPNPSSRGPAWILNAGVPTFTGFFGRDTLTSGWQAALLGPAALRGALAVAASTQATSDEPWRDAEPGKMLHELRRGPLSMLGLVPRDAYYGTQTTPAMFLLGLSELWHWTGDAEVLRDHLEPALRTFEWAERYGDRDGDGFLEYERRSPQGLRNQGWKDSDEGIRHADGSIVEGPIATVEEQAFHYLALERMAEILLALDDEPRAEAFLERAARLRRRWHEAFWMPDLGYYALALDGEKRQVRSITSNPGHALGTGIVPPEHARTVADRLMAPDLFSGWGIRTLSTEHPSFNPLAYHLGTVWPVENATFALGFKRYGLDDHVERLAAAVFEAAAALPDARLPEAIAGHERRAGEAPVSYPSANSPQAWSASAVIQLVQVLLGLYPFAPLGVLGVVRPRLPEWLPEVRIRNLRVGRARLDLRFERRPDGSASHHVERRRGALLVVAAAPPAAVDGPRPLVEQLELAVLARAPGRLAGAARIALGVGRDV